LAAHPDVKLLFTDLELPGANGQELAAEVVRRRPDLVVLHTTGYSANAVVHREVLARGTRYLSKPYALAKLATTVRELLDAKIHK
jgi:DNA-binding NtrC family response regulator